MKSFSKLIITTLSGVVIAACSSGGISTVNERQLILSNDNATGGIIELTSEDVVAKRLISNMDYQNYIEIDGKKIRISTSNPNVTNQHPWSIEIKVDNNKSDYEAVFHCCEGIDGLTFGVVEGGPNKDSYYYYNGIPSKDLPLTGQANYKGYFILSGDQSVLDGEDYYRGDARFNVDFAAKSLTGELRHKDLNTINLSATLIGNNFVGSASSSQLPNKATLEGKFYGDNAKQLGGMFYNKEDDWSGAFGAVKQ